MSTNLQKRKTKQVRIREDLHRELKIKAAQEAVTISKLLDKMCEFYLKNRFK